MGSAPVERKREHANKKKVVEKRANLTASMEFNEEHLWAPMQIRAATCLAADAATFATGERVWRRRRRRRRADTDGRTATWNHWLPSSGLVGLRLLSLRRGVGLNDVALHRVLSMPEAGIPGSAG